MAFRSLSSLVPKAADLLALDVGKLAEILLVHLDSYRDVPGNSVHQNGKFSQTNFLALQNPTGYGPLRQEPEYGDKQPEVNRALMEAWNRLVSNGTLIRDATQPAPWFVISRAGEEFLMRKARYEKWERLGVERVKADLVETGGIRDVGPEEKDWAWEWVRMKENKPPVKPGAGGEWTLIAKAGWPNSVRSCLPNSISGSSSACARS
jgi:hypothetical protein